MVRQLIRFGGVGWIATLVHVLVAVASKSFLGFLPMQANFGGFCAALVVSYFGHAHYTFDSDPRHVPQFLRFVAIALAGLATSSAIVWLIDTQLGIGFGIAMVTVAFVVPLMTFITLRLWVFAGHGRQHVGWRDLALPGILVFVILAMFWGREINHDTAWYLLATRQWLAGARLYVDLIEVNPPLNFYLTIPALALADLLQISDANGQYLWLALLIFASLCWCRIIIKSELAISARACPLALIGIATAFVLPALDNMGQRDQMLVILAMPWILGQMAPLPSARGSLIARAACAALGVCLKPHFIVFPATAVLLESARQRSLRPILSASSLTFLLTGSAYVLLVAIFHPAYLGEIVPIAHEVYAGYSAPMAQVAFSIRDELLVLLVLALVALAYLRSHWPIALLFAMSVSGLASYLMQSTGFAYHKIPFLAFLLTTCVWIVITVDRKMITASTCALALFLMIVQMSRGFYQNPAMAELTRARIDWNGIESLMTLTPHVSAGPGFAFAIRAHWSSRYPANWLVPGAINRLRKLDCVATQATCARLTAIAARNRSDNIADIQRNLPTMLVIDKLSGYFDVPRFDWLLFMAQDPAWATVFNDYRLADSGPRFDYYRRMPSPVMK